jgi:hypothetical protein
MGDLSAAGRAALASSAFFGRGSVMHAMKGPFKVFLEDLEIPVQRREPGDQHVIVVRAGEPLGNQPEGGLEAAADPVADHRPAELLGNGETEPRFPDNGFAIEDFARPGLQNEAGGRDPRAPSKSQKF